MLNEIVLKDGNGARNTLSPGIISKSGKQTPIDNSKPEILFVTSYPPRECGIATYSHDLVKALNNKFSNSFSIKVCALESGITNRAHPGEVKYVLDTNDPPEYVRLARTINSNDRIKMVLIQHEFGFF